MKRCPNCDRILNDNAHVCFECGTLVSTKFGPIDVLNLAIGTLSFFIPVAGIVLYLSYRKKSAPKARAAGIGTFIGFTLSAAIVAMLYFVLK